MRSFILIFALISGLAGTTQQYPFYKNYSLEKNPSPVEREVTDQLYYYNKYLLTIEYEYDPYAQSFFKYHTEHYRVKLNTDAGIEEFNKVYIDMEDVNAIVKVEARVIKPTEVLTVDVKMEKYFNEDEDENYSYFAVKGLELGDELEIIYTLKKRALLNGDQFYFQGEYPIYNFDFRFIVPNDAYFAFLPHNSLPEPQLVDTILQRHQYDIHLDTIPAFKSEYFSEYMNVTMKLDAVLKDVDGGIGSDYSSYNGFVNYANAVFNHAAKGKDLKMLKVLNDRIGVKPSNKQIDNVRRIENYIKNEFLAGYGAPGMSIAEMIATGKGDMTGSLKLLMGMFSQANIPFEYGMISDRYDTFFSPDIDSEYFLQKYFMYFPDIDAYMSPYDYRSRLGFLDYKWVPNHALFLTSIRYPYPKTTFKVKPVKATNHRDNVDSTIIVINVNDDFSDAQINIERHLLGYKGGEYQVYYYLYSDSKKKSKQEEILDVFRDNSTYKMTSIENVEPEDAFIKPLIIKGEVTSLYVPLFEKAGSKTIFRLGEIFGEYSDPREVDKKKTDFVFANPFTRTVEIIVNFPRAVKVDNLDKIPVTDKLTSLDNLEVSARYDIGSNRLYFKQKSAYHAQRYRIEDKEEMMKVFRFHTEMSKVNLIIEWER